MNMEDIKDGYFEYLVKIMTEAIKNADAYDCRDFTILKLELILNLNLMFNTREHYNQIIEMLRQKEEVIDNGYGIKRK